MQTLQRRAVNSNITAAKGLMLLLYLDSGYIDEQDGYLESKEHNRSETINLLLEVEESSTAASPKKIRS